MHSATVVWLIAYTDIDFKYLHHQISLFRTNNCVHLSVDVFVVVFLFLLLLSVLLFYHIVWDSVFFVCFFRLHWLQNGSRELFGTIVENKVRFLTSVYIIHSAAPELRVWNTFIWCFFLAVYLLLFIY